MASKGRTKRRSGYCSLATIPPNPILSVMLSALGYFHLLGYFDREKAMGGYVYMDEFA